MKPIPTRFCKLLQEKELSRLRKAVAASVRGDGHYEETPITNLKCTDWRGQKDSRGQAGRDGRGRHVMQEGIARAIVEMPQVSRSVGVFSSGHRSGNVVASQHRAGCDRHALL